MAKTQTAIELPAFVTVRDFAQLMNVSPIDVIKTLMGAGIMANINQEIDFDTAAIVAEELGFEAMPAIEAGAEAEDEADLSDAPAWRQIIAQERARDLVSRPPVVTMLGHVDHGKTSLLDVIRRSSVAEGEAGGITQHIGAYQIEHDGQRITFLDTPGHEAFTAMRARGAQATDIAILVVAADDGVMPQTREAIDHARAAKVPIIVALNKIDLPNANQPRAMQQLSDAGLTPDAWGGDTLVIPVSAKQQDGIEDLLEAVLLTAEDLAPKANPKTQPSGVVLEARMERGRGVMATLLVQNGLLKQGQTLLIGEHYGRIKAMYDYNGKKIKQASPSTPVSVSGLSGIPSAGEQFTTVKDERTARKIVADAEAEAALQEQRRGPSLDDFFARFQTGETETLLLIVKADAQGSLEPILSSLERISTENEEVKLEILHSATGPITESDVMLASASDASIIGFNTSISSTAKSAAAREGIEIKTYDIIYKLFEDVERAMKGLLGPQYEAVVIGRAEVRAVFKIRGSGSVAGAYMRTGVARRNATVRVVRGTRLLHEGRVSSLKRFAENVREVRTGFEFGVGVQGFNDFVVGDVLEFIEMREVPA